ncbi:hypothetical protein GCM10027051_25280 [Niabella terrae]
MKLSLKKSIVGLLAVSIFSLGCNNGDAEKSSPETAAAETASTDTVPGQATTQPANSFDINSIPVSDKELGTFPYLVLPQEYKPQNKPIQRDADLLYFPIDGKMTALEGRVWKANIAPASGKTDDWSQPIYEKRLEEAIVALGGVKIFDGKISQAEYDNFQAQASYLGEEGSIGYTSQTIKVYGIHRADGANIFIQLAAYSAGGYLNILEQQPE